MKFASRAFLNDQSFEIDESAGSDGLSVKLTTSATVITMTSVARLYTNCHQTCLKVIDDSLPALVNVPQVRRTWFGNACFS